MDNAETLLAMHVNPWSFLLLLLAAVAGFVGAAAHHKAVKGSGMDTDDSPSGWALVGACLFIVAGLLTAPASGIQHESKQLADKALTKYGVMYMEDAARSQVAHLVVAKNRVVALVEGRRVELIQEVDPGTLELVLKSAEDGAELLQRESQGR